MGHLDEESVEAKLARLAHRRYGLVTRVELLRAEVSPEEIRSRLRSGALLREHRGVYRVGHRAPSTEATYLAAVLACGDGARLCGSAGAFLLELVKGAPPRPEVLAATKRTINGIVVHRGLPDAADATVWRGIPVIDRGTHPRRHRGAEARAGSCEGVPRGARTVSD